MLKQWHVGTPDERMAKRLSESGGISMLCAKVLAARGFESIEAAEQFVELTELSDPFLLRDMRQAVERILRAIDTGEQICVYGDYDCDGITATVMLTEWLKCAGANVQWYIPTREEGYGMRSERIRSLAEEGVELIVTVDNGISAHAEAQTAKELGIDLVITDHHRPGETLPEAYAVVDPHRSDCMSPFKEICGAVVALKLIAALEGGDCEVALEQFGDLAALATLADVMPLKDENRTIVRRGLELLTNTERMGLRALLLVSGIEEGEPIAASTAAFQITPRINAAGRMAEASVSAKLLLTDDPEEAQALAEQIQSMNSNRKNTEQVIMDEILMRVRQNPDLLCRRVLTFAGENWSHGVVGLVAGRLTKMFGKPCFLMAKDTEGYRGSARSVEPFSIFDCLQACAEHLIRYGGHPSAGGFTVRHDAVDAFQEAIQAYAKENYSETPVVTLHAECTVSPRELTVANVRSLQLLEPYGEGNPVPLFVLEQMTVAERMALSKGQHTKLRLQKDGTAVDVLLFGMSPEQTGMQPGMVFDFLAAAEVRPYQGRDSLSLRVEDWRVSAKGQTQAIAAQQAYETDRRGEALPDAYYVRMCPTRSELIAVYQAVNLPVRLSSVCARLQSTGVNWCKLRVCVDIFTELGLLEYDVVSDTVSRMPVTEKRDLESSTRYQYIQSKVRR